MLRLVYNFDEIKALNRQKDIEKDSGIIDDDYYCSI